MTKRVQGLDADGNPVEMYVNGDVHVSEIDPDDNWKLTTEDDNSVSDSVEFVGPRPKK